MLLALPEVIEIMHNIASFYDDIEEAKQHVHAACVRAAVVEDLL